MKSPERRLHEENVNNSNHWFIAVKPWINFGNYAPSQRDESSLLEKRCRESCTNENHRLLEYLTTHNVNAAFKRRNNHLKVILLINTEGLVIFNIVCYGPCYAVCSRVLQWNGIYFYRYHVLVKKNRYIIFISTVLQRRLQSVIIKAINCIHWLLYITLTRKWK